MLHQSVCASTASHRDEWTARETRKRVAQRVPFVAANRQTGRDQPPRLPAADERMGCHHTTIARGWQLNGLRCASLRQGHRHRKCSRRSHAVTSAPLRLCSSRLTRRIAAPQSNNGAGSAALATPHSIQLLPRGTSCCTVALDSTCEPVCTQPSTAAPLARSARRDGDITPVQRSERDAIFDATESAPSATADCAPRRVLRSVDDWTPQPQLVAAAADHDASFGIGRRDARLAADCGSDQQVDSISSG